MSDNQSSRRKFLQALGVTAGTTLIGKATIAAFTTDEEIMKLNPEQQKFMIRYGQWMDQFIEVNRLRKAEPANAEHNRKLMQLTEEAETFRPELNGHMKDDVFSLVYKLSIERASREM